MGNAHPTGLLFPKKVFFREYRIDFVIKIHPYQKLAPHPGILVHDFLELFGIGEDHGGIFVEVVFKTCMAVNV